jgi:REP element-mobilizing transposase RayT
MDTIARRDAPNTVWHITSRVNWRAWHLGPEEACGAFLESLSEALQRFRVDILAYVVMSNHYHAVVRSPDEEPYRQMTGRRTRCRHFLAWPPRHPRSTVVGQCVRALQLSVGGRIQGKLGLTGHFWEGKHHRRRLDDEWALVTAIAYDHRNPVVQGMAPRAEDYVRSSAGWWAQSRPAAVPLCTRHDFPFGSTLERVREHVVRFQMDKRLDDVMAVFQKSRLPIDSPRERRYLEKLMREAGIDPLGGPSSDVAKCGTSSAVQRSQVVFDEQVTTDAQVNR